ncbi:MAG: methionyl-tRNA formyltransferase [Schleiferiaceae bacterium]|nr:methionyl-tRNA formyltransferase [Schleiferiaceae bacterium]
MSTRIIFFGTPEFASATLEALVACPEIEVVAVVTASDKPAGRGLKMQASHVSETAERLNLSLLKAEKLQDPGFLSTLASFRADIFVVVAFRMLPQAVWGMPPFGTFNVHASLLPDYRGAAPIQWAIANGEKQTGVTTFLLNERIDEGGILLQEVLQIGENEPISSVYQRLMIAGAGLAVRTIDGLFNQKLIAKSQIVSNDLRSAPKIYQPFGQLDLLKTLDQVHDRIRACDPFPGASFLLDEAINGRIKVFSSEKLNDCNTGDYALSIKLIISNNSVHLSQGEGVLNIHEIQWPGKRKMKAIDFLRGFRLRGEFTLSGLKSA